MSNKIKEKEQNYNSTNIISNSKIINEIFLKFFEKTDKSYLINDENSRIIHFLIKYLLKSKYTNFNSLLRKRQDYNKIYLGQKVTLTKILNSTKLIVKIFIIYFSNISLFSNYTKIRKELLNKKIYLLIKKLFIKGILSPNDLNIFLEYKLSISLCPEDFEFLTLSNFKINNNIKNIKEIYSLFDFLISFIKINLSEEDKTKFIEVIKLFSKDMESIILKDNINNEIILSKSDNVFQLIKLSKISYEIYEIIRPFLIRIYKNKINFDFIFNDLSEQFTLHNDEKIESLFNYLNAKNSFLSDLFYKDEHSNQDILINRGFIFNEDYKNGIICSLSNNITKNFPKEGFSLIISFCLMNNNNKNNRHNIFSFYSKEKNHLMKLYIENNNLKYFVDSKEIHLFSDIKTNENYVFLMIFPKDNKSEILAYLNNNKKIVERLEYPSFEYNEILIGFDKDLSSIGNSINNFKGILGTFIMFNGFLINDKNMNQNILKILELKGDYELLININDRRDMIYINKNFEMTLKKFSLEIIEQIEVIISPKSIGNIQEINNLRNNFICNYYNYDISQQDKEFFKFKFVSDNSILNSITCPFEYKNSLIEFYQNHGIIYLQLELYYLMGILSLKVKEKQKQSDLNNIQDSKIILEKNEVKEINETLNNICLVFFSFVNSSIYVNQKTKDEISINNFFYTLNDFISISAKYGCKMDKILLTLIINNLKFFLSNNLLKDTCDFIFIFENYCIEDELIFEALFNVLMKIIDENYVYPEIDIIKYIFNNMINFNKIYLQKDISKDIKKKYSELIQKLLIIILEEKKFDLLEIYLLGLEKNIDEMQSVILSYQEQNNIFNLTEERKNEHDEKVDEKNDIIIFDINKINNIKLIYKYLKNLFVVIDLDNTKKNFLLFCSEIKANLKEFFNGLILFLNQEFDPNIMSIYQNNDSNEKDINKIIKGYYSEMIKSLCIGFLDTIFVVKEIYQKNQSHSFVKNYIPKHIRNSFSAVKNKFSSVIFSEDSNKRKSQNIIGSMGEKDEVDTPDNNNNIQDNNFSKDDINNLNSVFINFEFLKDINFSLYTIGFLFLLIYKDKIHNKKMIKIIRNSKNEQKYLDIKDKIIFSEEDFINNKYYIDLINIIIDKLDKDGDNYELIKLCFELYFNIMIKIANFYIKNDTEKKEEILGYFLNYKDNCLFNIAINNLSKLSNEISIEDSSDKAFDIKKNLYKKFSELIMNSLITIIDSTLLLTKDPFYFVFLNKGFLYNNLDLDFILGAISFMINKFIEYNLENLDVINNIDQSHLDKIIILECNYKNILFLIYKLIFYPTKRKTIINNISFINNIYKYFCSFLSQSKLLYIKILFSIEDYQTPSSNKKLIIEVIYEILFELCIEYMQDPNKKYVECFEDLMFDILIQRNIATKRFNKSLFEIIDPKSSKKTKSNNTFFYTLDKVSFKKENSFKLIDGIQMNTEILKQIKARIFEKYKHEFDEKENVYSICIIFLIKILISIKYIDELLKNNKVKEENAHLKQILSRNINLICQDCLQLNTKFQNLNPLSALGKYNLGLYKLFKNYITNEFKNKNNDDVNNLIDKLLDYALQVKSFSRVIYNYPGSIRAYSFKDFTIMTKNSNDLENKKESNINSQTISENSTTNSDETKNHVIPKTKAIFSKRIKANKKYNLNVIYKKSNKNLKYNIEEETHIKYIEKVGLKSDIVRIFFSSYFKDMLTFDKDFIIIKKLYKYIYNKEIENIDEFDEYNCPLKLKNYISNKHYFKPFLKKDFNFFSSCYFKYSHGFVFNRLKKRLVDNLKAAILFPSKEFLLLSNYPNNNIIFDNIKYYYCELITNHGSIFGKFFLLENGVLFLSDLENDKRNNENYLDFIFSTTKFDILKQQKRIFLDYSKINEIINRTFCFQKTSQEFFMKNGRTYFFNFFDEKNNQELFKLYKQKSKENNFILVKNPKEYFENENYTKKYKDNIITTYQYLLAINKYSSRSYNNINEYPIMPWLIYDNKIREFDLPMSLQTEESRELFEDKYVKFKNMDMKFAHNNFYSSAPYTFFYLSRINPFTNGMIKFQGNCFEIPERQFLSVEITIQLCPKTSNNREPTPEIFEMPEIYYNLNCNDFGKSRGKSREHNISLSPFANNGIAFCYDLLGQINNDVEINNNINKWIDFIFGVNQYNDSKDMLFRRFNDDYYGQNLNFKKQISDLKDQKMDDKNIYNTIKSQMDSPLNFGLCPSQILSDPTPKRNILTQNIIDNKNKKEEIENLKNIENNTLSNNVVYFSKNNKNLIVLYDCGLLYIFSQKKKSSKEYDLNIEIKTKGVLLSNLIYKYTFCEIKDDFFIFCGFLDKTLKFYNKNKNIFNYLLDTYTTSIIAIKEKEFITGHINGKVAKWELINHNNNDNNKTDYKLKKIVEIKSNENAISCIEYEQALNVILCCDNDSIIIRSYFNLEFLTYIKMKEYSNPINKIIKVKIFNCNLIYAIVMINENKSYELRVYSLNGTFYKKIEGNFSDFKINKKGDIIVNDLNNNEIIFYKGCHLEKLFTKKFPSINENIIISQFDFENPNILYLCCKEKDITSIKKAQIELNNENYK